MGKSFSFRPIGKERKNDEGGKQIKFPFMWCGPGKQGEWLDVFLRIF
jgi:hypothetical protein